MKKNLLFLFSLTLISVLIFTSCKKEVDDLKSVNSEDETAGTNQSKDNKDGEESMNAVFNDINNISGTAGGRIASDCYTTSTVIGVGNKAFKIDYNQSACTDGFIKEGSVTVALNNAFSSYEQAGAKWTVTFNNCKFTRNGRTTTLTGMATVTNVTGGAVWEVLLGKTIVHKIKSSNMALAFQGNIVPRLWEVAKKHTFKNENSVLSLTVEGDTTVNNYTNVITWGTNRYASKFYQQITEPGVIVLVPNCGLKLKSGQRKTTIERPALESILVTETVKLDNCKNTYTLLIEKGSYKKTITLEY